MLLHLRELRDQNNSIQLNQVVDISDEVRSESSVHNAGPFQVQIDASAAENDVIVHGHAEGPLELICSRCLNVFPDALSFSFEEIFTRTAPDELEISEEDDRMITVITDDKVELDPYIKENILLELPLFPLCDEHCRGLCPTCGTNRNTEPCSCNEEKIDPRWSGLKDLLQQD